jgi:hypothetical protein
MIHTFLQAASPELSLKTQDFMDNILQASTTTKLSPMMSNGKILQKYLPAYSLLGAFSQVHLILSHQTWKL